MPFSRRLLAAALVTTAALGLAACGPDNSPDQSAKGTTAPAAATGPGGTGVPATKGAAPTTAPPASPAPATPGASASVASPGSDEPEGFCTHVPLPAGQKWIYPVKGTTTGTLTYRDTKDACGVNDVSFEPVGADRTAAFAPTAKGHLSSVMAAPKDVDLAGVVKHINECLASPHSEKGSYPCSAGDYKVAVDASGKVTELWERAHS
ncbi:hypothetical protein SAMN05216371_7441 [Streptomyces sp. TLI_053]|uniref:hypothetical protein n=1 Tax=Streptomyces sp. TLI_053 TaxID=1855352 RepID=UPI00087B9DA2|nr:hypothetical protein [Streptomyces sp. TLI_053]SDT82651.1 hypothetical protein SAMN05216371_7441 [Streptomyces sp. TLI_053]